MIIVHACTMILVLQGVLGAQPPGLQGVQGAQPPGIAGGPGGAAPRNSRAQPPGMAGRSSPEKQGVQGAQPPGKAGGFGGAPGSSILEKVDSPLFPGKKIDSPPK